MTICVGEQLEVGVMDKKAMDEATEMAEVTEMETELTGMFIILFHYYLLLNRLCICVLPQL